MVSCSTPIYCVVPIYRIYFRYPAEARRSTCHDCRGATGGSPPDSNPAGTGAGENGDDLRRYHISVGVGCDEHPHPDTNMGRGTVMPNDKTNEVAEATAETIDEKDIDEAKDKIEDADDIDSDEVRDEIRDEDEDTRGTIDKVLEKLDAIEARIDAKLDGISRVLLDSGAVISDGEDVVVDTPDGYVDIDDLDLKI